MTHNKRANANFLYYLRARVFLFFGIRRAPALVALMTHLRTHKRTLACVIESELNDCASAFD